MKFDVKTFIIGLVVGITLALSIGAYALSMDSQPGKYQMFVEDGRVWVLDTSTGEVFGSNVTQPYQMNRVTTLPDE